MGVGALVVAVLVALAVHGLPGSGDGLAGSSIGAGASGSSTAAGGRAGRARGGHAGRDGHA
ncbi:MAG: hypothetical protein ACRDNJ_16990, partial [Solirubrobacteraceae bacterium]